VFEVGCLTFEVGGRLKVGDFGGWGMRRYVVGGGKEGILGGRGID
jgi:hypothetical protein